MKLSLCLEMLFTDRPFTERMAKASELGYGAIEFWDWRDKDLLTVAGAATSLGLVVAAMSGNRQNSLINPEAHQSLIKEMDQVFDAARKVNTRNIMMLSDVLNQDGSAAPTPTLRAEEKLESIVNGLVALSSAAEEAGITLLLEPLNTVLDHRGCFLDNSTVGLEIVRRVGSPNVKLLYDIYHMSMMGEDAVTVIEQNCELIGYVHVADKPGRHQPGTGEIDYQAVNRLLNRLKYDGFIGMEFSALGSDEQAAKAPLEIFT